MVSLTMWEHLRAVYLIDEYYSVLDIATLLGSSTNNSTMKATNGIVAIKTLIANIFPIIETSFLFLCILHAELRLDLSISPICHQLSFLYGL